MATDDEIIEKCLTPELHKLNEKLANEQRSQATEAEFLGAFETAMHNMIKEAQADIVKQVDAILDEMEKRANFFYDDACDLANKTYERGFYDGIHNARAKIKEALEKAKR